MPQPKRHRNVRVEDDTWWDAVWVAKQRDERISDVVRDLLQSYLRRNRAILRETPRPPGWTSMSEKQGQ